MYFYAVRRNHNVGRLGRATRYVRMYTYSIVTVLIRGLLVKVRPQGNNLPQAVKIALCAVRNGWKLENAKQSYQTVQYGRSVPWSDQFVDGLKRGVLACRVMCVSSLTNFRSNRTYSRYQAYHM